MDKNLTDFVKKMRDLQKDDDEIRNLLLQAGWDRAMVDQALMNPNLDIPLPPLPPKPVEASTVVNAMPLNTSPNKPLFLIKNNDFTNKSTKWDFLYLLHYLSLWIGSFLLTLILISLVSYIFPDNRTIYANNLSVDPISVATLIVIAPIYLFTLIYIQKSKLHDTEIVNAAEFNKKMSYITSALCLIIGVILLIVLIASFLGGNISLSFFINICIVLIVCACVLSYYFKDRVSKFESLKKYYLASTGIAIAVIITTMMYIFIHGNPYFLNGRGLDQAKLDGIRNLNNEIYNYYTVNNTLPASLSDLSLTPISKDPETKANFQYIREDNNIYKICTNFKNDYTDDSKNSDNIPSSSYVEQDKIKMTSSSSYTKGDWCFEYTLQTPTPLYRYNNNYTMPTSVSPYR